MWIGGVVTLGVPYETERPAEARCVAELVRGERLQLLNGDAINDEAHCVPVRPAEHIEGLLFLLGFIGGDIRIAAQVAENRPIVGVLVR